MNKNELLSSIIAEIANITDQASEEIHTDASIIEDLELSSLEVMTLLGHINDSFGVKFDGDDLRNIDTIDDLVDTLCQKMK